MSCSSRTAIAACVISSVILALANCSAKLLTRFDYEDSLHHHRRGEAEKALRAFPKGESGGFITTMEKTHLRILGGSPEIGALERYAKKVDDRVRFKVSRDIKGFFYMETREGYYASEHEVIWMHMLLGLGNLMRGDRERAGVELKKSANLLSTPWSDEGHFDDPFLRIMAAGLWTMLGQWDEARVDFRRAAMMEPRLAWAKSLAARDAPPKELVLLLGGPGPEPRWSPGLKSNPFRGFRGIVFDGRGRKSALAARDDKGRVLEMNITPDSSNWYRRHFIRDNEISDLLKDSNYALRMTASGVAAAGGIAAGVGIGTAIFAGGVGLGAGIIWLAAYINSGEAVILGLTVMAGGAYYGYTAGSRVVRESGDRAKKAIDDSETYRFVRYLPEYAWVAWSDTPLAWPLSCSVGRNRVLEISREGPGAIHVNGVTLAYYPDVAD